MYSIPPRGEDRYLMMGSVVCRIREGGERGGREGGGRGGGLGGTGGFPFLDVAAGGSLNLRGKPRLLPSRDFLTAPNKAPPWPGTGVRMSVLNPPRSSLVKGNTGL